MLEVIIRGRPKEIADLVVAIQDRQEDADRGDSVIDKSKPIFKDGRVMGYGLRERNPLK